MKKIYSRTLNFLILVPTLVVILLVFPGYNHLLINLVIVGVAIIATHEMTRILGPQELCVPPLLLSIAGGSLPLATYLAILTIIPSWLPQLLFILYVLIIFSQPVFTKDEKRFLSINSRIANSLTALIYPGALMTYFVRISSLPEPSYSMLFFVTIIIVNDSLAYLVGILLGKKSRGITPISPNKSPQGYLGGIIGSLTASFLCYFFKPEVFYQRWEIALLIGVLLGFTTILGDLIESALKRSASIKDSGRIFPGRGGMLDSVDSLLFSAPLYFYLLQILR